MGFGRTGQDGNSATNLIGKDRDDAPAFFRRKSSELACGAIRVKTVYTSFDEPIRIAPQFLLIDSSVHGVRDEVGSENALKAGLGHDQGLSAQDRKKSFL